MANHSRHCELQLLVLQHFVCPCSPLFDYTALSVPAFMFSPMNKFFRKEEK